MNNTSQTIITKSFNRILDKGKHRGFITYEELTKSLGKRHFSQENVEKAFLTIFDNKVCLVEKKSDYSSLRKKELASSGSEKSSDVDKSDDPIRMYLREMGGVELLSREGEIAIAKRIEEGKNVMIGAISQSPITAKKIYEWKEKLESNELLVREIIDIDSTYSDTESEEGEESIKNKDKAKLKKTDDNEKEKLKKEESEKNTKPKEGNKNEEEYVEVDEFNPSLAIMEQEIRPRVLRTIDNLCKNYAKLTKYQK